MITEQEHIEALHMLSSEITARAFLASKLGMSHGALRDIYSQAGYPAKGTLTYEDFKDEFDRHDIAQRIIVAFPNATWCDTPTIKESESDSDTPFEKTFKDVVKKARAWHYIHRADILSNLGEYSVVLMGFDDVKTREQLALPVTSATTINYMSVYSQDNAKIHSYNSDVSSPEFGQPDLYQITLRAVDSTTSTQTIMVHASRILHLAENCLENDYFGTPRLRAVYNRLKDLDKIFAAAAEGFWRNAWPGLAANKDPQYRWTPDAKTEVKTQFQDYAHGLSRTMQLEGVTVQQLAGGVSSPKDHVNVILGVICGASEIPKRILTGSEQGEMASTQDRENWHNRVLERRTNWAIPSVLEQFVEKLDRAGVLAIPEKGYTIQWDRNQYSLQEQTEIDSKRASMIIQYASVPGVQGVYSHYDFLTKIMHNTPEQAKEMIARTIDMQAEEYNEEEDQLDA